MFFEKNGGYAMKTKIRFVLGCALIYLSVAWAIYIEYSKLSKLINDFITVNAAIFVLIGIYLIGGTLVDWGNKY